jgi:hypothetical protein
MSAKKVYRIALFLPKIVALLIILARRIVQAMTNNPWFPNQSLLTTLTSDTDALEVAEAAVRSRTQGAAATRDVKWKAVVGDLNTTKSYVEGIANLPQNQGEAAAIIESAGMVQRSAAKHDKPILAALMSPEQGQALVRAKAVGRGAWYAWQYSLDGGKTWVDVGTTHVAHTTVSGLTVGTTVLFRFRSSLKSVTSPWSDPVSLLIH